MNRIVASLIGLGVISGVVSFGLFASAADHTKDKVEDVKKAVESMEAILIDVREESEWQDGHLVAAKHLPLSEISNNPSLDKLKAVLGDGKKVVYLHCASGRRCLKAADSLKKAGFETRPLKPGYQSLVEAGFKPAK